MELTIQLLFLIGAVFGHSLTSKPNIGEKLRWIAVSELQVDTAVTCMHAVYIITDDQDIKLGSLDVQPQLKKLLTENGMFFQNAFVTTPVCCPSRYYQYSTWHYVLLACTHYRSSTLTGKFVHNHHTYENSVGKGCSAPSWRTQNENKTMGAYMTAAGYKTGFFG